MRFDQDNPTHRILVALGVAVLIAFAVWGVWMSLGFVLGAAGWLASTLGGWLSTVSTRMTAIHANVALIALCCGAIFGVILGFNLRVDRFWERFGKKKRAVKAA